MFDTVSGIAPAVRDSVGFAANRTRPSDRWSGRRREDGTETSSKLTSEVESICAAKTQQYDRVSTNKRVYIQIVIHEAKKQQQRQCNRQACLHFDRDRGQSLLRLLVDCLRDALLQCTLSGALDLRAEETREQTIQPRCTAVQVNGCSGDTHAHIYIHIQKR